MGERVGLLLLVLGICWACADAFDITASRLNYGVSRNERLCTLCEGFTSQAVDYLAENKTQTEIITAFHHACSRLHSLEVKCILLVDYYVPLFFLEFALIRPEEFCEKVNLCGERTLVPRLTHQDTCTLCQQTVADVLTKLKDPETQLEVIEFLLKACNKVEYFVQECKKLVFEYGPIVLTNAEKLLETTDICGAIYACKPSKETSVLQAFLTKLPVYDA